MPALKNTRHEAFARELAKGKGVNEAYVAAGYKSSPASATRLSKNVKVVDRVKELVGSAADKAIIDITRTLQELTRIGLSDIRKLFDENGNLKPIHELDDDMAAAIASVEVVAVRKNRGGTDTLIAEDLEEQAHGGALKRSHAEVEHIHKFKLWDKNSALDKIAKHLGMLTEKHEHSIDDKLSDLLKRISGDAIRPQA